MVRPALPALVLLPLAPLVASIPTSAATEARSVVSTFSWSQWVEDIIAHPDHHLSPEEAVAAWKASFTNTTQLDERNQLQKRYSCNTIPNTEAPVADAVWCINYLAGLGSQACVVNGVTELISYGGAHIVGVSDISTTSSSCNDVARGAGSIMDYCTRADNTVQGSEYAYGNGDLLVWIRKAGE